jgi:hypothetical protein
MAANPSIKKNLIKCFQLPNYRGLIIVDSLRVTNPYRAMDVCFRGGWPVDRFCLYDLKGRKAYACL